MKRYSLLFPQKENGSLREEMPAILESLGLDPREYQTGKEKVSESDLQPWSKIFYLVQHSKQHDRKVLFSSFHLNGHT